VRKHKANAVAVALAILFAMAYVVTAPPSKAMADDPAWPKVITQNYSAVRSALNGDVVASQCNTSFSATESRIGSYSSDGNLQYEVFGDSDKSYSHAACESSVVTQTGNTISYGSLYPSSGYAIRASGAGGTLWTHTVTSCSGGAIDPVGTPAYAPSFNTVYYFILGTCQGSYQVTLVVLDASTGALKFRTPMGDNNSLPEAASYNGGYVYFKYPNKFVYLDSNGEEDALKSFTVSTGYQRMWAISESGTIASTGKYSGSSCTTGNGGNDERLVTFRPVSGGSFSRTLPGNTSSCMQIDWSDITSNSSGVVYDKVDELGTLYIVPQLTSEPVVTVSMPYSNTDYYHKFEANNVQTDVYGHILVHGVFQRQWNTPEQSLVLMYDSAGNLKKVFNTESLPQDGYGFRADVYALGLTRGYIYLLLRHNGLKALHRIPFGPVGMDYPRGKLLGDTSTAPETFNYVAMGDSFSSGEGVEPFETGTANPGVNECHRSALAYPRLLAQAPGSMLDLGDNRFVACSGATTSSITLGYNGEGAQIDKLSSDTDLVTLSIGGNNMPFVDLATACVTPGLESCDETAYQNALAGIVNNVIPRVEYALTTLRDHLTTLGSNAKVIVVGYPQLVPETWVYGATACGWLQSQELPAIRTVTSNLNTAIKNEVDAIGGSFTFLSATEQGSPFQGHELCRSPSDTTPEYFNNFDLLTPLSYNLHPNNLGQEAYAQLVNNYLAQHPLS